MLLSLRRERDPRLGLTLSFAITNLPVSMSNLYLGDALLLLLPA